jgi:phage shock protein A
MPSHGIVPLESTKRPAVGAKTTRGEGRATLPYARGMGVFRRFTSIMQAKAHRVLDHAEDPRDTLDLSYEKQLQNLQRVRRSVAEVATARKRLELQAVQLQQQAAKLQVQAKHALAGGREDLAREALARRSIMVTELTGLRAQHDQVASQEQKLVDTAQHIQAQVEAFRTRKETLKATYTAAEARTRMGEAISGISGSITDASLALERAEDRVTDMQARAGAIDELMTSGALGRLGDPVGLGGGGLDDIQARLDRGRLVHGSEDSLPTDRIADGVSTGGEIPALPGSDQAPNFPRGADSR